MDCYFDKIEQFEVLFIAKIRLTPEGTYLCERLYLKVTFFLVYLKLSERTSGTSVFQGNDIRYQQIFFAFKKRGDGEKSLRATFFDFDPCSEILSDKDLLKLHQ